MFKVLSFDLVFKEIKPKYALEYVQLFNSTILNTTFHINDSPTKHAKGVDNCQSKRPKRYLLTALERIETSSSHGPQLRGSLTR